MKNSKCFTLLTSRSMKYTWVTLVEKCPMEGLIMTMTHSLSVIEIRKTDNQPRKSQQTYVIHEKATKADKETVWNFEPKANSAKWVSFNFSSGSTGPAKVQIYRNAVPVRVLKNREDGISKILGYSNIFKMGISFFTSNGFRMSAQGNYNGFICYNNWIYLLSLGTKLRFTLFVLNQKNPESWAPLIERKQIKVAAFYTPQMLVFAMSESFKKSNLSSLMQFATGGSALSKTSRDKMTEAFEKYHSYMKNPYIHQ